MGDASSTPLNLVVVGGVAGGMSFAARARRLSETARITIFEKGPYVGYANCGIPYALGGIIHSDEALILQTPASIKARYNVDIQHNTEVVSINRSAKTVEYKTVDGSDPPKTISYDKLILAQGAEPFRPPIPGAEDAGNVFPLQTIPDLTAVRAYMSAHPSKSVAIIGGGFIGLEAAESLHALGMHVSIIEYMPHVFPPVDQDIAEPLHAEIRSKGVSLYLNARVQKIVSPGLNDAEGPHVLLESGDKVPGDIILLVVGVRPRVQMASASGLQISRFGIVTNTHMQSISDPDIYAVGDMAETTSRITHSPQNLALAGPANRQGRLAADHIFGREVEYRGNVGTSVCQVFGLNVGLVGPSVTNLRAQGLDVEYVTVHPPNHAGYYPGATPLTLKLAFDKSKAAAGRILGAQVIGKQGVDKRIDVIATAMQANLSVFDLEHLELAYAPPFGSAKDPVNMAGFVASNVLRGDTEIVHSEHLTPEMLEGYQVVDVRGPGEFARGYIVGAKSLPLNELRGRLGELDKGKKTLVYCQVGYRGYLAYRILKMEGFDVVNLDGGFKEVSQGGFKTLVA